MNASSLSENCSHGGQTNLPEIASTFDVMLRVPRKTSVVRVVMENEE
jgi:hypothetical protein